MYQFFSFTFDIDDQSPNNCAYDSIGNLTHDDAEDLIAIRWSVYGKILKIQKLATGSNPTTNILYTYDAAGNRTSKTVTDNTGKKTVTWYVRDAQGNSLSTYTGAGVGSDLPSYSLTLTEQDLYGSGRIGVGS